MPSDLIVEVEEGTAPPISEDPADRRGADVAHTDQADPQLRLLTATPAIRGRASAVSTVSGHQGRADSQDSGGYTEELARTLPRRIRAEAGHHSFAHEIAAADAEGLGRPATNYPDWR